MRCSYEISKRQGAVLVLTFFFLLVLAGLAVAVGLFAHNSLLTGKQQVLDRQAFYLAEAGVQRARQQVAAGAWSAATCTSGSPCTESFPSSSAIGQYQVVITGSNPYTITADGYLPDAATVVARREVTLSTVTTYTNLSRNPNAVASASSSKGDNTPDQAKDGSTSTNWESNTKGSGSWLAMDLQLATTLNSIIVKEDDNIDGLTIEWSDDASSWTGAAGLSVVESPSKTWTATFTAASHRYFRAYLTSVPSSKRAAIDELETYNTASSAVSLDRGTFSTQW
ncbi:MAG: discoidin domain-containing protein [Candidatus Omnitrophica bacterium]|nr:discoidin domain-containing protein [Candidatus Omnitrophota bacterium]